MEISEGQREYMAREFAVPRVTVMRTDLLVRANSVREAAEPIPVTERVSTKVVSVALNLFIAKMKKRRRFLKETSLTKYMSLSAILVAQPDVAGSG
jgi:hypothetical protein